MLFLLFHCYAKHGYRLWLFTIGFHVVCTGLTQTLQQRWWVTDGTVNSITSNEAGSVVYVGGNFHHIGPNLPFGALLDPSTGQPDPAFVKPNGTVHAVAADGAGGWFIGGSFTMVGNQPRQYVARINADGSLHPWAPSANSSVLALAVSGSVVFVGGGFTQIGGQARNHIAALGIATGQVSGWNPDANELVSDLVVNGSRIYAGGRFTQIGGQARNYFASLDTTTGQATVWDPDAMMTVGSPNVYAMAMGGGTVFVAGGFSSI
ncbi:MAG TPA: delta-60 repeat domain-containing protein, partial [Flavobacteriales bacterium]|nr:delta-60 repeat domain-containing protein [Flavobacteriales bacterium]